MALEGQKVLQQGREPRSGEHEKGALIARPVSLATVEGVQKQQQGWPEGAGRCASRTPSVAATKKGRIDQQRAPCPGATLPVALLGLRASDRSSDRSPWRPSPPEDKARKYPLGKVSAKRRVHTKLSRLPPTFNLGLDTNRRIHHTCT